jgi:poly-gamma-glutamate capsule biosynthesis protein CapA/YwtB (metallophosphatase superfamily)
MKELNLVAAGDSLITMRQSVHSEPEFLKMVEMIREADVAFTNLEMLLHDYEYDCYPAAECGGTYTRAPPYMVDELVWMGFDLFSTANNHSLDYMYGGLFNTILNLDERGIPHAGTGVDLAEARMPTYMDTGKGRLALVSACSTFASFGRAGYARRDMKGRPGLNPLRYDQWYEVKLETLKKLKEAEKGLDLPEVYQEEGSYHFLTKKFVEGSDVGLHTSPHKGDMEANLESIKDARKQADWVLMTLHAHEGRPKDSERPAEFIEEFARAAIDAGSHCIIGHGHHAMRGIEIRDGKPIFYSLGNFIFQNETVYKMPADFYERYKIGAYDGTVSQAYDARQQAPPRPGYPESKWFTDEEKYWISFVPWMSFKDDKLEELRLYPIELGREKTRSQRGRPVLADKETGEHIFEILSGLCKPYGTDIKVVDNVGVVQL